MAKPKADPKRCEWVSGANDLMIAYHDREWGVPVHDDRRLFEFLTLEGAQAGLSWSTILNKREGYRQLFADFDPRKVARFTDKRAERLRGDPRIVRNAAKIRSTVNNARCVLETQKEFGSLDAYLWSFVEAKPIHNRYHSLDEVPAETEISQRLSKELKKRGYNFVGPTIVYAFMQAVGLVNDHTTDCFRHRQV